MKASDDLWDALKRRRIEKKAERIAAAGSSDDGGWTKHTEYHWSRYVCGEKLDYWPSTGKFMYKRKVRVLGLKTIYEVIKEFESVGPYKT